MKSRAVVWPTIIKICVVVPVFLAGAAKAEEGICGSGWGELATAGLSTNCASNKPPRTLIRMKPEEAGAFASSRRPLELYADLMTEISGREWSCHRLQCCWRLDADTVLGHRRIAAQRSDEAHETLSLADGRGGD